MQQPAERPLGVTLIAILLAINGIAALIGAFGIFGPVQGGTISTVIQILFSLALLYLAYGMWTLQAWAWLTTLVLQGLNALFALIALFAAPAAISAWISLILAAIVIVYLVQPGIREDFGRRARGI